MLTLAYLLALALLAYIVYRFGKAYDGLSKELREMRVQCVGHAVADAEGFAGGGSGAAGVVAGTARAVATSLKAAATAFAI